MSMLTEISQAIWETKYRYRRNGKLIDQTVEETWKRVAAAIAQAEKSSEQAHWQRAFYRILDDFRFLPGGRIIAGAGTAHHVTLFNCFVMDIAEDSLKSIFTALQEGALTLQQGGGIGYDFSVLRPRGQWVKQTGVPASGPVSFMKIWDTMCSVMLSTGARRGAMMAVLRCDHPDIEEFIAAKRHPHELRHFNVSVMVSDAFMKAVKNNEPWPLIFPATAGTTEGEVIDRRWGNALRPIPCHVHRVINARELWNNIIRSAYDTAEPGVLFGDTINRANNLWYREQINATNPCGEIPLPSYGACNLGAINLTRFISSPFSHQAKIDWAAIEETVKVATRFLDNVIDISHYPLDQQREQALGTRRIGLGITGLADALVMLNILYGSNESIAVSREIMKRIAEVTWQTSIDLAHEKNAFPFYAPDYLQSEFVMTLNSSLQKNILKNGIRNSHHNTIAPTGTISLLAKNISNGIEPIFRAEYERHVRIKGQETKTFHVRDYAYQCWLDAHQNQSMPSAWIDTQRLTPHAHLQIQGAVQPYIDNAISKTINLPEDFPFEKLTDVYTQAYELGLKGCTIFRPNPITGSVLEAKQKENPVASGECCQYEGDSE